MTTAKTKGQVSLRAAAVTAIMGALGFVLMFISFPIPFLIPSFITFDVSELPALFTSFLFGPVWGVLVCAIKNLLALTKGSTGGVGEFCNFLIGSIFVFTAGMIYKHKKTRKNALVGMLSGAAAMAVIGLFLNYYVVYPLYFNFMEKDVIIGMYSTILPSVKNLWQCLIIFNLPFTFAKGIIDSVICFLIYKRIQPLFRWALPEKR